MPRIQSAIDFDGAIIIVRIEVSADEEAFFRAMGRPVPSHVTTTALLDIGASYSAVHPMILDYLGAAATGEALSRVPGQHESSRDLYDVRLILGAHGPAFEVAVVRIAPATPTVTVLIGRDVLKQGTLLYDGENETFSFWF